MNVLTSSEGSSVYISPIFNSNIEFKSITIEESIGGELPSITIEFNANIEDLAIKVNDKITGFLMTADGFKTEFTGYIYEITRLLNAVTVKILCCVPEFTRGRFLIKYPDINQAINSSYGGKRLDSLRSDINRLPDGYYYYQRNISNYKFCTRLCKGYKYNTTFAYSLSGLKLIDLTQAESVGQLKAQYDMKEIQGTSWTSSKLYEYQVEDPNFNDLTAPVDIDENHSNIQFYESIVATNSAYAQLINNYLYNSKLDNLRQSSRFNLNKLYPFQLGDKVTIISSQFNYPDVYLSKRIITYTKTDINIIYEFKSIK